MAAVKRRERNFPQAEFEVTLASALSALITTPGDIHPNATWHFQVDGVMLVITRIDPPEESPGNSPGLGAPDFAAVSRKAR